MAGLTKQQEIIVGVGVLALLGYFALRSPASSEVVVEESKRLGPTPPQLSNPVPTGPEEDIVKKKAKKWDDQVASVNLATRNVTEFQKKFNKYVQFRAQVWASLVARQQGIMAGDKMETEEQTTFLPMPKFMRRQVETLLEMALELQRDSGQVMRLNLSGSQLQVIQELVQILTIADIVKYNRILNAHGDAELDLLAREPVNYTFYQNNTNWLINVGDPRLLGVGGLKGDFSKFLGGNNPDFDNDADMPLIGANPGSKPLELGKKGGKGKATRASTGRGRGSDGNQAEQDRARSLTPPAIPGTEIITYGAAQFNVGGTTPPLAPANNISQVQQTTNLADGAFNTIPSDANATNASQNAKDRILDLQNNGDPAPNTALQSLSDDTLSGHLSSDTRTGDSRSRAPTQSEQVAAIVASFNTNALPPMRIPKNNDKGAKSKPITIANTPATKGGRDIGMTAQSSLGMAGSKRKAKELENELNPFQTGLYDSSKKAKPSASAVPEQDVGLKGNAGNRFNSSGIDIQTDKIVNRRTVVGEGDVIRIDETYARVLEGVYQLATTQINEIDSRIATKSEEGYLAAKSIIGSVGGLWDNYEALLRTFPSGGDAGAMTVYSHVPYPFKKDSQLGDKIDGTKNNYFQWVANTFETGGSDRRETAKVRAPKSWDKLVKYRALVSWIKGNPEYKKYKQYVDMVFKKLVFYAEGFGQRGPKWSLYLKSDFK